MAAVILGTDLTTPMELVYRLRTESERVVVSFPQGLQGKANFNKEDYFLEEAMKTTGIAIPLQQRAQYPELATNKLQQAIYLDDTSFGKAFYNVYFQQNMPPDVYSWRKIS